MVALRLPAPAAGRTTDVEVGFDDVDFSLVDGVDGFGVDVDDLLAPGGEDGGGGQADVAEADDGNALDSCFHGDDGA